MTNDDRAGWSWRWVDQREGEGGGADWGARLAAVFEQWESLESLPGAQVLKANLQRQVISLPATEEYPALVVKRYRMVKRVDRIKTLVAPSRAEREWRALRHLEAVGVAAPIALAVGEQRSGRQLQGAGLVMQFVADSTSFPSWWESASEPSREKALETVGELVGSLHAFGLDHSDLHLGNILMSTVDEARPIILDLHATRIGSGVSSRRRVANLAKLYHSLDDRLTRPERHQLLAAYCRRFPAEARPLDPLDRLLLRRSQRLEAIRLASRSRRCWKSTTEFVRERRDGWTVYRRRDFDPADWWSLVDEPTRVDEVLKKRRNQLVGRARAGSFGSVVLKIRDQRALWRGVVDRFLGTPLGRAWGAARALDVRGISNPKALAFAIRTRFGIPLQTVLITKDLSSSEPLHSYLQRHFLDAAPPSVRSPSEVIPCRRSLAENVARFVRVLHDGGIYHRDLNPMNLLIDPATQRLWLVDLDSIYPGRLLTERRRQKNLIQVGLLPEGHVGNRDRLRFLCAYDAGDRQFYNREFAEQLWEAIGDETVAIIARTP